MNPLRFLVDAFVNTFGITRPSAKQEKVAGLFIAIMLLAVVVFVVTLGWVLLRSLGR